MEIERQAILGSVRIQSLAGLFQIGILCRKDERNCGIFRILGFLERTLKHYLGTEAVGTNLSRNAFLVAIAGGDVHDGRNAAAVFGTETARVHIGVTDDVGIEHREQADGMERIVDHHAVQKHLVLDGRTTTDVELTALVASEDDTGHHLQVLGEVGLTAHARNLVDGLGRHCDDRGLSLGAGLNLVGGDGHRFQFLAGLLEEILTADALALRQCEGLADGVVTHAGDQQGVFAVRDSVDVEIAIFVGRATVSGAFQVDIGEHHRLASDLLVHETFDAIVLRKGCNSRCKNEQTCENQSDKIVILHSAIHL